MRVDFTFFLIETGNYNFKMAVTSQMVRAIQATNTWSAMFPEEQKTREQSVLFVKKLVAVGISSITYLRTLFPESAYSDQNLNGLKLKLLLDKTSCYGSNMLVSWMKGCFEAIEKQYLRQMTFAIYEDPEKPEETLETYTYKFCYDKEDGASISELETNTGFNKKRKFEIRKSTEKMLRTILLLTQTLKPLPRKIHLSMKLGYYDNVTPTEYEPPGFKEGGYGNYVFQSDPINIKVGDVSTHFHTVKLRVSVDRKAYEIDDNSANNTQDEKVDNSDLNKALVEGPLPSSESVDVLIRSYASNSVCRTSVDSLSSGCSSLPNYHEASCEIGGYHKEDEPAQAQVVIENQAEQDSTVDSEKQVPSVTQTLCSTTKIGRLVSSEDEAQLVHQTSAPNDLAVNVQSTGCMVGPKFKEDDDFLVRCPCGVNYDDGLMILCELCNNWQHAICFGVLHESEAPSQHVCEACSTPSMPCTDPSLKNRPQQEMYCLYRRALVFLHESCSRISVSLLAQALSVNISVGKRLFSQLQKDKLIRKKKKHGIFANHTNVVRFAFPLYLNRVPHEDNAEDCNVMNDITQTPHSMQSDTGFDADVTPDLPISSLRESISASKAEESVDLMITSLDDTLDIHSESQDVTVGTQGGQLTINSDLEVVDSETNEFTQETAAETMATAGDTMVTLGSQLAIEEKATHTPAATQDLVQDSEVDEENRKLFIFDSKTERDDGTRGKRRLLSGAKLSRGKKNLPSETMNFSDFEILDSQRSEAPQAKKSKTSTDIEV